MKWNKLFGQDTRKILLSRFVIIPQETCEIFVCTALAFQGLLEANDIHNNGIAGFGRQPDSDSGALRDPPRTDGWLVRARPVHRQPHPFPQQPHRNEIYNGHQGGVFILGEGRGLIEHNNIYGSEN
ncbi:uncharacterized protein LOC111064071 isoform X2 [Nilaparvata lugens]|uniref:uncharacterized protein LOC111064071 isoform X2 n=1 Tax=Nilaparvata lugens TaxID=108931 RepID=UPI00193D3AD8|nr:uncharacterized protein LOC111064071 isoform X2 [Nilaparvata lugens]